MDQESIDQKYKDVVSSLQFRNVPLRKGNTRALKFQEFKIEAKKRWVQAKAGFLFGAMAGGVLGFILSLPTFIKHRQVSILVFGTLGFAGFFAAISSVGTLIRQEDKEMAKKHIIFANFVTCDF